MNDCRNRLVVKGHLFDTDKMMAITVENGLIAAIDSCDQQPGDVFIAPGLVDLQINGYGGHDFNSPPLDKSKIAAVTRELWKVGVTAYLPTVITNEPASLYAILAAIAQACSFDSLIDASIAGIHLEGPFISPEDGPRGAHPRQFVCAPDWDLFQRLQDISGGRIKIVTLSPEWPEAPEFIARCVASGVVAAIGHTAAAPEQIANAVAAGATMSTHLGNGSHVMLPRLSNYLWQQLAEDTLWAGLIADGFHLPDDVLKVMLKAKGDKAFIVSDSVYLAGMPPGEYTTHIGGKVVLTPEGKLHLADNPKLLAGSVQPLIQGVENLVRKGFSPLPQAWEMASSRPARFIGLPCKQGLSVGAPADFILVERESGCFAVAATYKAGIPVYDRQKEAVHNE